MKAYINYTGFDIYLPEGKMQLAPVNYLRQQRLEKETKRNGYWFALPTFNENLRFINEHDVKEWCKINDFEYDSYSAKIADSRYDYAEGVAR